jgi:hypothetical protein
MGKRIVIVRHLPPGTTWTASSQVSRWDAVVVFAWLRSQNRQPAGVAASGLKTSSYQPPLPSGAEKYPFYPTRLLRTGKDCVALWQLCFGLVRNVVESVALLRVTLCAGGERQEMERTACGPRSLIRINKWLVQLKVIIHRKKCD